MKSPLWLISSFFLVSIVVDWMWMVIQGPSTTKWLFSELFLLKDKLLKNYVSNVLDGYCTLFSFYFNFIEKLLKVWENPYTLKGSKWCSQTKATTPDPIKTQMLSSFGLE